MYLPKVTGYTPGRERHRKIVNGESLYEDPTLDWHYTSILACVRMRSQPGIHLSHDHPLQRKNKSSLAQTVGGTTAPYPSWNNKKVEIGFPTKRLVRDRGWSDHCCIYDYHFALSLSNHICVFLCKEKNKQMLQILQHVTSQMGL